MTPSTPRFTQSRVGSAWSARTIEVLPARGGPLKITTRPGPVTATLSHDDRDETPPGKLPGRRTPCGSSGASVSCSLGGVEVPDAGDASEFVLPAWPELKS